MNNSKKLPMGKVFPGFCSSDEALIFAVKRGKKQNVSYWYRKIIYFIDTTRNNNSSS
jgi:hypothetical protein